MARVDAVLNDVRRGTAVRCAVVFTDAAGDAADPTTQTAQVRAPDGTITTPVLTKDSLGHFHVDVTPDAHGDWLVRLAGTGTVEAVALGRISVPPDAFE